MIERFRQLVSAAINPNPRIKSGNQLYRLGIDGKEQKAIRDEYMRLNPADQARARYYLGGIGITGSSFGALTKIPKITPRPTGQFPGEPG